MLYSGFGLLRDSGRVLLEAAPRDLDPDAIGRALAAEPHVVEVHDLHVWEVTSGFPALSAHVTVRPGCDTQSHRRRLAEMLSERFGITALDAAGGGAATRGRCPSPLAPNGHEPRDHHPSRQGPVPRRRG